jgi:hypothetical protein
MCDVEGCNGVPKYGNNDIPVRCFIHRKGHKRLGQAKCKCGKPALYGYTYGVTLRCINCKNRDMCNVGDKRCQHYRCTSKAQYAPKGAKIAAYCNSHKLENMVNISHKICEVNGCYLRAYYGELGDSPSRCSDHRGVDMLIHPSKPCVIHGCSKIATHHNNGIRTHCELHIKPTDIPIMDRCGICNIKFIMNDNSCPNCEQQTPTEPLVVDQQQLIVVKPPSDIEVQHKMCCCRRVLSFVFSL